MQLLGILILLGILALLLVAAMYFANTQKTTNHHTPSPKEDLYRSWGLGNVIDAQKKIDEITGGAHQAHHGTSQDKKKQKER